MFELFSVPRRMEDLALFTRHAAGAMQARAPLPDILRAFAADSESGALSRAVEDMADQVESGVALSEAMEKHTRVFPAPYRRLVALGEQGKTLGGVMSQLAGTLEEGLKTYEQFRRVAIYPLLVLVLLFLDVCFIMTMIVPKFVDIFSQLGADRLPVASEGLINLFASNGLFLIFSLAILVPIIFLIGAAMGLRMRAFGYGRFQLNLPLIGPVLRRAETARFANNLALLLDNRLPLGEALGLLVDASDNSYVRAAVQDFHNRFQSGERLSDLVSGQPLFPAGMAAMIASAEDQGGLAETLRGMGRFYSERTSHGLMVLREVFEPLMLLLIGLFVAFILLALYSPLFAVPGLIN
jgi:type II secretory pathway component PulF